MKRLWVSALAVGCVAFPLQALAWGDVGHEIVATIAWGYLTPQVQTKVQALLDQDKDTLTPPDFAHRATWADKYRDSDRPAGPAYTGTNQWHFVDIPAVKADSIADAEAAEAPLCAYPTLDGVASTGAPAQDCVVDKIKQFEVELANPATPVKEQIFALKFLMHFIGDIHQPLHATDNQDHGGNCVEVAEGPYGKESLHSYWDTGVILDMSGNKTPDVFAKVLAAEITPAEKAAWEVDDPALWAAESAVKAHDVGYALHMARLPTCDKPNMNDPIVPPGGYEKKAQTVAREQLEKAGVRLAFVLNKALH